MVTAFSMLASGSSNAPTAPEQAVQKKTETPVVAGRSNDKIEEKSNDTHAQSKPASSSNRNAGSDTLSMIISPRLVPTVSEEEPVIEDPELFDLDMSEQTNYYGNGKKSSQSMASTSSVNSKAEKSKHLLRRADERRYLARHPLWRRPRRIVGTTMKWS